MIGLRPFWRYFGSKWRLAPRYPYPLAIRTSRIVEPFAGAAGYSLRHHTFDVILVERNPVIAEIWRYLIASSPADIRSIPLVEHVDALPDSVPEGARLLVGMGFGAGDTRPRRSMSSMIRRDGGWPRERIAAQVSSVRHWKIIEGDYTSAPRERATWFVDPPYITAGARADRASKGRVRYPFGADALDHASLGLWCRSLPGLTIVCEELGASWLPFEPLGTTQSVSGKRSYEAVWLSENAS